MARTDYYNDPHAPAANSVVPSTTAVVTDSHDRIVLIRRRDNNLWALPGGAMELGESIVDAAVREVKEETGLDVEISGLIGVYTNPRHVMAYADGEVRQQFSLCFTTRLLGGQLRVDSESTDIAWTSPGELASLDVTPPRCGCAFSTTFNAATAHTSGSPARSSLAGGGTNSCCRRQQARRRPLDRTMHRIPPIGVTRQDLRDSIFSSHRRALRASGQVRARQHV